jgi:integrase
MERYLSTSFADAKKTTAYEARRLLTVEFLPHFQKRPLNAITTHDVIAILDPILTSGRPSAARHAYAQIRAFFAWALSRRYVETTPLQWLKAPAKATKRDRVLSEVELAKIYTAAEAWGFPFGHIVLLLIVTGQRRGEIASLKWDYIDFANLSVTLPATTTKNKIEHTFPITEQTARLIHSLPKISPYLFPARGSDGPFCGWSRVKNSFAETAGVSGWGLHDLRRTFSTRLALLRVAPHIIERALNHVSGEISGIAAVYNRWSYLPEMREAMFKYEEELLRILSKEKT